MRYDNFGRNAVGMKVALHLQSRQGPPPGKKDTICMSVEVPAVVAIVPGG